MRTPDERIYLLFYEKIFRRTNGKKIIPTIEAKSAIGKSHNIPKDYRYFILKRMRDFGWLEWLNRDLIELRKVIEV